MATVKSKTTEETLEVLEKAKELLKATHVDKDGDCIFSTRDDGAHMPVYVETKKYGWQTIARGSLVDYCESMTYMIRECYSSLLKKSISFDDKTPEEKEAILKDPSIIELIIPLIVRRICSQICYNIDKMDNDGYIGTDELCDYILGHISVPACNAEKRIVDKINKNFEEKKYFIEK